MWNIKALEMHGPDGMDQISVCRQPSKHIVSADVSALFSITTYIGRS